MAKLWIKRTLDRYPVIRGMLAYGMIWPCSSITKQCLENDIYPSEANYWAAAKFGSYGALVMAPMLHKWITFTDRFYKDRSLKTVLKRIIIERATYNPFALFVFFFGFTLLETWSVFEAIDEVKHKLLPTWAGAVVFWATMQSINYSFVPNAYRVAYVGVCGYLWGIFMSYMKELKKIKAVDDFK